MASQTWPYTPLFIPQQRVCNLCVPNSPLTPGADIAGTYSAGSRLPWNHYLPQGRFRFWEPRHPKLAKIRHYSFHNRGFATCLYQIALWPREPMLLVDTVQGLDCHKIIICHRDAFVSGNQGTLNLAIYATIHSCERGYATCVYQIALWPREPMLLVDTVQGLDCHKIIICHRDAFVSGNHGIQNLAIYATIHSTKGACNLCVPSSPLTPGADTAGTYSAGSRLQ